MLGTHIALRTTLGEELLVAASVGDMSLAGGWDPRKTTGNRLSGLLEAEEEDEFYQTTYGGFTEESGDDEYQGGPVRHRG